MKRQGYVAYFNGAVQSLPSGTVEDVIRVWRNENNEKLAERYVKPITFEIEDEMETEFDSLKKRIAKMAEETVTEKVWIKFIEGTTEIKKYEQGQYLPPDAIEATLTYSVKAKAVSREEIKEYLSTASDRIALDMFRRLLSHGLADSGGGVTRERLKVALKGQGYIPNAASFDQLCKDAGL